MATCPEQKVRFRQREKSSPRWPALRREALARLKKGKSNRAIALALKVSEDTVSQWKRRAILAGELPAEVGP